MRPLAGLKILDLTRLLPGPWATRQLAAMGAEVVKIEDPAGGDYARWYPPLVGDPPTSGLFHQLNAGKRSVCLDLKQPADRSVFEALLPSADVLVDSFRPGVLDRLSLGPEALLERHPRLIYCAITGFGLTGPDAKRAGHDLGYVARSGALALTGPATHPVALGVQIADIGAAQQAVSGILAALWARERTGRGSVVDVSLLEAAMGLGVANFGFAMGGPPLRRGEQMLDGSRPCYGIYSTQGGQFLAVGALEPTFWQAFLAVIGLPELADAALDGGAAGEAAKAQIQAVLATKTRDQWMALFAQVEACVEPVLTLEEVAQDPQVLARGTLSPNGLLDPAPRLRAWADRAAPSAIDAPTPGLGADTAQVLAEWGVPENLARAVLRENSH